MKVKEDCFGYDKLSKKCKIMTETLCNKRECTFYKTWKQYREGIEKYPFCGKLGKKQEQGI